MEATLFLNSKFNHLANDCSDIQYNPWLKFIKSNFWSLFEELLREPAEIPSLDAI